jgi:hypothetical protein
MHAQSLKNFRSEVQEKIGKKDERGHGKRWQFDGI